MTWHIETKRHKKVSLSNIAEPTSNSEAAASEPASNKIF